MCRGFHQHTLIWNTMSRVLSSGVVWSCLGSNTCLTTCASFSGGTRLILIESVDSICRDSADTQYMLIQTNFSKSPKQLTYKPLKHPTVHLRVFSWRKTHPVALKSIAKVPNHKVTRWPKCFSFFFRRASSNLRHSQWFSHKTAAFFTHQCTSLSLFSWFEVTRGDSNRSQ